MLVASGYFLFPKSREEPKAILNKNSIIVQEVRYMRLLMCIVAFMMVVALAESVQLGNTNVKPLLLGGMSKNVLTNENISNQTNLTNQTNATNQGRAVISISKSMNTIPVTNRYKSVTTPNNIAANSITYRFTT
jgi:hypothetical protein